MFRGLFDIVFIVLTGYYYCSILLVHQFHHNGQSRWSSLVGNLVYVVMASAIALGFIFVMCGVFIPFIIPASGF